MKLYLIEVRYRYGLDGRGRWGKWRPLAAISQSISSVYSERKAARERCRKLSRDGFHATDYRVTTWKKER